MSKTLNPLGNVPGYGNPMRLAVRSKLNFFGQNHIRPGSVRHPIQPVLMELKYSQVPTVSGNNRLVLLCTHPLPVESLQCSSGNGSIICGSTLE